MRRCSICMQSTETPAAEGQYLSITSIQLDTPRLSVSSSLSSLCSWVLIRSALVFIRALLKTVDIIDWLVICYISRPQRKSFTPSPPFWQLENDLPKNPIESVWDGVWVAQTNDSVETQLCCWVESTRTYCKLDQLMFAFFLHSCHLLSVLTIWHPRRAFGIVPTIQLSPCIYLCVTTLEQYPRGARADNFPLTV